MNIPNPIQTEWNRSIIVIVCTCIYYSYYLFLASGREITWQISVRSKLSWKTWVPKQRALRMFGAFAELRKRNDGPGIPRKTATWEPTLPAKVVLIGWSLWLQVGVGPVGNVGETWRHGGYRFDDGTLWCHQQRRFSLRPSPLLLCPYSGTTIAGSTPWLVVLVLYLLCN